MHRWIEHTAELELEIDAATEEGVFVEAAEALRALLGMRAHGGPALRQVEAAAPYRQALLADWLNDALAGKKPADLDRVVVIPVMGGAGPYSKPVRGIFLPERAGLSFEGLTPAQAGPAAVKRR